MSANAMHLSKRQLPLLLLFVPLASRADSPGSLFGLGLFFLAGAQAIIFLVLLVLVALGSEKPCRRQYVITTLWVSPLAALLIDGVLLTLSIKGVVRDEYIIFQAFIAQVVCALTAVFYAFFASRRRRSGEVPLAEAITLPR